MPWDSFKAVASGRVGKNQLWQQATEALVLEKANALLLEFFGQNLDHLARAVYLKKKILTIAILSDQVLADLEIKQSEFIEAINLSFQTEVVRSLYFLS
ncbi:DUF721 domain-containing protein [Candidatus Nomurabacteria bacterium]|nr:DUF721 domain-containing protein [Candidatus Nomurabacteria bacterium]